MDFEFEGSFYTTNEAAKRLNIPARKFTEIAKLIGEKPVPGISNKQSFRWSWTTIDAVRQYIIDPEHHLNQQSLFDDK